MHKKREVVQDEDCALLERTRELLRTTRHTYLDIAVATGLRPHWLSFLASGKITDPSVNKIQKLYEFLSNKKLRLA